MKASEFEALVEEGGDITQYLDMTTITRPHIAQHTLAVAFPEWMVTALDKQAMKYGVTREALLTLWTAERLESTSL